MRIIFMGTPAFALPALQALIDSPHEIVAVYSQPPRPAGRGMKLTPSPVQQLADAHHIPVHVPISLKPPQVQEIFAAHKADIAVVAAYGLLLPQAILDAPKHGCLNIHPSSLPRWRGAAPIQRTIMAGDTETECCIMQMDAGLDTGAVLAREAYAIPPLTTSGILQDTMAAQGARLLLQVIDQFARGKPPVPDPQSAEGATYAAKITKADQPIDWQLPASQILSQILGLNPSPGATTMFEGEVVKIFHAELAVGNVEKPAGMLINDALLVNCGGGTALRLTELQRAGKSRQSADVFLQSFPLATGICAQAGN